MLTRPLVIFVAIVTVSLMAAAASIARPVTSVRERDDVYMVAARFEVPEPAAIVNVVLTDYANIPRFMPDVRTSCIVERTVGYARVEQEAVSRFMLFSKRMHLVLDVAEGPGVIRFRDRCNRSFVQYEGVWTIESDRGITEIGCKLFEREAATMIERLRDEIGGRAASR